MCRSRLRALRQKFAKLLSKVQAEKDKLYMKFARNINDDISKNCEGSRAMKLMSIKLCNFRQFYGKTPEIVLACGERNTTIIHGNNGAGKQRC